MAQVNSGLLFWLTCPFVGVSKFGPGGPVESIVNLHTGEYEVESRLDATFQYHTPSSRCPIAGLGGVEVEML
ncbi:MAG: hypothetical protein APG09_00753 [Candidatus Methanofastidiosum methylothiophilum]|uniref:Uncharacterized protein n=1 Tax=Candidatus Methanofastidiosum methylothiophilum TaxID=1705564 RepID=A0A150JLF2_9EURY|nr:MAG: hypothetical protein APG09_00753 [Candidatus Methanofastidiosum methylthiophilus]